MIEENTISFKGILMIGILVGLWFFSWQYFLSLENEFYKILGIYSSMSLTMWAMFENYLNYRYLK